MGRWGDGEMGVGNRESGIGSRGKKIECIALSSLMRYTRFFPYSLLPVPRSAVPRSAVPCSLFPIPYIKNAISNGKITIKK
ncbi:hypothetical protein BJP36_40390 [Moorena producens JHB]|uniref:Uncharacterized protein n=1 Tax=Moorena producens (strain JHB) TaxID=1454205 RepID=A0A9Q9SS36_MOOP1|nr:hypothetical protein [Moorena producens]WAN68635.1 hypothetical protein BJP36_40390 [Moorena producens JHB]